VSGNRWAQWAGTDSAAEKASGRVANAVTIFLSESLTLFHVKHMERALALFHVKRPEKDDAVSREGFVTSAF